MVNFIGTGYRMGMEETAWWPSILQRCPEYSPKIDKAFPLVEVLIRKGRNFF
jgi:hypothetical protein